MKKTTFIIGLAIVLLAMSCGNKDPKTKTESEEKTGYPEKITLDVSKGITGGLSEYFTVENAIIKISTDDWGDEEMLISIELQKNEEDLPFDESNVGHKGLSDWTTYAFAIEFAVDLFDEDGLPILTDFDYGFNEDSELALLTLNPDETGWIQYELHYELEVEEVLKIKSIKVKSTLTDVAQSESNDDDYNNDIKSDASNSTSNTKTTPTSSTESSNWDETLDAYEDYIDSYIELYEKAQNGDTDALAKYPEMIEKANKLNIELSSANDDMTAQQMARFMKLQNKLAAAVY